jgi:hypothetical protein
LTGTTISSPHDSQTYVAYEHSATAVLEQRLREAIGSRNWPLVGQIAKKLAGQDRQAG